MILLFVGELHHLVVLPEIEWRQVLWYFAHGGLQGFRSESVDNLAIISKEEKGVISYKIADVADVKDEEQDARNVTLHFTASHYSSFRCGAIWLIRLNFRR